jgi:hypothetical protein
MTVRSVAAVPAFVLKPELAFIPAGLPWRAIHFVGVAQRYRRIGWLTRSIDVVA